MSNNIIENISKEPNDTEKINDREMNTIMSLIHHDPEKEKAFNKALEVSSLLSEGPAVEYASLTALKKSAVTRLQDKYDFDNRTAEALFDLINFDPYVDAIMLDFVANNDIYKSMDDMVDLYHTNQTALIPSRYFLDPEFNRRTQNKTIPTKLFGNKIINDAEEVEIPEGIEVIGAGAFFNCRKIRSIKLPSTLKRIDTNAFRGCESLESITIPDGVTYIGKGAFRGCTSLLEITLPRAIKMLPGELFQNCTSMITVNTTDEISVGFRTFYGCKNLRCLKATIVECDEESFAGCSTLRTISLKTPTIQKKCFAECVGMEEINFLQTPDFIGSRAFERCYSLKTVNYGTSICEINTCEGINWLLSEIPFESIPTLFKYIPFNSRNRSYYPEATVTRA